MADPNLPDTSIIPLVTHGLSKDFQRQIQIKNPATMEELIHCCRELCVERLPMQDRLPTMGQGSSQGYRSGTQTAWRHSGEALAGNETRVSRPVNLLGVCGVATTVAPKEDMEKNE